MVVEEVGGLAEVAGLDGDHGHLELGQLQPQNLIVTKMRMSMTLTLTR